MARWRIPGDSQEQQERSFSQLLPANRCLNVGFPTTLIIIIIIIIIICIVVAIVIHHHLLRGNFFMIFILASNSKPVILAQLSPCSIYTGMLRFIFQLQYYPKRIQGFFLNPMSKSSISEASASASCTRPHCQWNE